MSAFSQSFLEHPSPSRPFSVWQIPSWTRMLGFKSKLHLFICLAPKSDYEPLKGSFFESPVPSTEPGTMGVLNKHLMNEELES